MTVHRYLLVFDDGFEFTTAAYYTRAGIERFIENCGRHICAAYQMKSVTVVKD